MKLYKLLFESVSENEILIALKDMLKSKSNTAHYLRTYLFVVGAGKDDKGMALAKDIYETNKPTFDRILKNATTFKHLSGGSKGNAFDLGNQILKLELETPWDTKFSSKQRSEKAATALFGEPTTPKQQPLTATSPQDTTKPINKTLARTMRETKDDIGAFVPMIYDQGTMKYPNQQNGQDISWTIMEKFEIPNQKSQDNLNDLLDVLIQRAVNNEPVEEIKQQQNLSPEQQQLVTQLSDNLRLKDDWFPKLVQAMWSLKQKGITDFHAGNIGVRRLGAQGTLVFFD